MCTAGCGVHTSMSPAKLLAERPPFCILNFYVCGLHVVLCLQKRLPKSKKYRAERPHFFVTIHDVGPHVGSFWQPFAALLASLGLLWASLDLLWAALGTDQSTQEQIRQNPHSPGTPFGVPF